MDSVCCLYLQKTPSYFSLHCLGIHSHITIHCHFIRDFGLKLTFTLTSSPVFTSIVVINYANYVHGRVHLGHFWSIAHQSKAQLSKLVNKSTCWENPSSSLVTSIGLWEGSHQWPLLDMLVCLLCSEGEFLLTFMLKCS